MDLSSQDIDKKRLQILWDKDCIRDVLSRYCRGVDRMVEAVAKSAFSADSREDHGVYKGTSHGFIDSLTSTLTDDYVGHHSLGQILIDLTGDTAHCETYFVCGMIWNVPGSPASYADVRGRYIDRMERTANAWQIIERGVVLDWTVQRPLDSKWDIADAFMVGQRGNADLVFRPQDITRRVEREPEAKTL